MKHTATYQQIHANRVERRQWLRAGIIEHTTDEVWCLAGYTNSTDIAAKTNQAKYGKPLESMIPAEYLRHRHVFSEEESQRLPKHQPWDHAIDLKPDVSETIHTKVYPMSPNKQSELDTFIKNAVAKGYIVPSKSPIVSPVFSLKRRMENSV